VISWLLTWLPETYDYRVIYMHRDVDEVLDSQHAMLSRLGEGERISKDVEDAAALRRVYGEHIDQVQRFLARRPCFRTLTVQHRDVLDRPEAEARRIAGFLDRPLDIARMTAAVDPKQYRSRLEKSRRDAE
jgi:sulfotransferase family protein